MLIYLQSYLIIQAKNVDLSFIKSYYKKVLTDVTVIKDGKRSIVYKTPDDYKKGFTEAHTAIEGYN